jgi:hypothetical protein
MKYYNFYRENNNFTDILNDVSVKKAIDTKIQWYQYLIIGIRSENNDKTFSYITLMYGEDMINELSKDFTPVAGVDYMPKKDKNKYLKVQR